MENKGEPVQRTPHEGTSKGMQIEKSGNLNNTIKDMEMQR